MNRQKLINEITELFARFRAEVENLNSMSLYDINVHSENVLIPILNKVFDLNLINANYEEKNASAVDLIDKENRVAIQVTSTSDSQKIKKTLETYKRYKRYDEFDTLFVYILTNKKDSYPDETFDKIIENEFSFVSKTNILDYRDILNEVNGWLSNNKLDDFLQILKSEFSESKIDLRRNRLENKETFCTQTLYPNILEVFPQQSIYIGKLAIDRDEVITKSWETDWKLKKSCNETQLVKRAMDFCKIPNCYDWTVFEGNLISFRALDERSEPMSRLVDPGTTDEIDLYEYAKADYKYERVVLALIDRCLQEFLLTKNIRWSNKESVYRFMPSKILQKREVRWKNKKVATRTVVKEIWDKEKKQITSFQQLSFTTQSFISEGRIYISITPTWSFTYNGYQPIKKENEFITAQKKLEKNQSVYQHFMFISYCFSNKLSEDEVDYEYIKFSEPFKLELNYKSDEY
jgi:hypothetical protein